MPDHCCFWSLSSLPSQPSPVRPQVACQAWQWVAPPFVGWGPPLPLRGRGPTHLPAPALSFKVGSGLASLEQTGGNVPGTPILTMESFFASGSLAAVSPPPPRPLLCWCTCPFSPFPPPSPTPRRGVWCPPSPHFMALFQWFPETRCGGCRLAVRLLDLCPRAAPGRDS